MIDAKGYRHNVGIILANYNNKVFWGKRYRQNAWQFPQGGVNEGENLEECLFRELKEEIGLEPEDVSIIDCSNKWLYYKIPENMISKTRPYCVGQKQKWFLLQCEVRDDKFNFDCGAKPEFDGFTWVSFWYPLREVIGFKREVYRMALKELAPAFFNLSSFNDNGVSHLDHLLDK